MSIFLKNENLCLKEYYPDALRDTYQGVSAYIYCAEQTAQMEELSEIKDAVVASSGVPVTSIEYIADAYEEIKKAHNAGKIEIRKYEDGSEKRYLWNEKLIPGFYMENGAYRFDTLHFCAPLQGLFHCLISHHICVNGNILVGSNLSQCLEFCNPLS